mgnify:CR=1 FL=1
MTTTLAVPESLRSYFTDRAVQSVVDHMLESKASDVPPDLDWNEIRDFHMAHASAAKVRADHAILLLDLWDAVWADALREHGITQDFPLNEYVKGAKPSPQVLWNDSLYRIHRCVKRDEDLFITNTFIYEDGEVYISLEYEKDGDWVELSSIPSGWEKDDDNSYSFSDKSVTIQKDTTHLDITPLQQAAQEAVAAVVQAVTR